MDIDSDIQLDIKTQDNAAVLDRNGAALSDLDRSFPAEFQFMSHDSKALAASHTTPAAVLYNAPTHPVPTAHPSATSSDTDSTNSSSDSSFFASLDYHLLGEDELTRRLNTNATHGLATPECAIRFKANGANVFDHHRPNYVKKLLFYVFGGFCSVLWVGVIVFFLCWQPLSNPPNVTNLALAILVVCC
ncbi:hypothetical protein SAMD00019534_088660 [Acytostelium subglobosum LB1]|uniref:hypothetical protein n=1 Tax=Acytostelium subglobosum LB1 TaxID=1410327 RepID=UPI0006452326|nr:hypothetical protein SAMD00019534_088660 [Acytostelium subglobosum LB1]GAM25691.1 hypothetical protein SAMD00019534_088660 [Acytostelium subglobosum LB1]|eukprot:XP_012751209.1 hypothetical protein SAMD00019534_088660 [Acytostelium subglobosum LB1]